MDFSVRIRAFGLCDTTCCLPKVYSSSSFSNRTLDNVCLKRNKNKKLHSKPLAQINVTKYAGKPGDEAFWKVHLPLFLSNPH